MADENDDDEVRLPGLPPNTKNYMTPACYRRLLDEREHLVNVERPEVVNVVAWAASNGDRSENGDYQYGKRRLREIDRRIRFLNKRIESAEVVDPYSRPPTDQIFFGATVLYCDQKGEEHKIRIVGIDEADANHGDVSWISPIATWFPSKNAGSGQPHIICPMEKYMRTIRNPTEYQILRASRRSKFLKSRIRANSPAEKPEDKGGGRNVTVPASCALGSGRSASCLTASVGGHSGLEDALDLFDVGVLADRAHDVHQMSAVANLNGDADELLDVLVIDHHADDA